MRGVRTWLLALALLLVAGCGGPAYLARLGWSEARILWRREPIDAVLARPALDPELRRRLALVLAVRDFARDVLGLRVGESYATFAAVERDEATVWVLAAARRDRLEAHTWWYPVAGRVPYKGFFDEGGARAAAQVLAARDLDTDLRRALAFSTLGWFADPLLSTTAAAPPVELADTVIHELFHATLYVPGASRFNESAANFVGHRGAIAFFCRTAGGDGERCGTARRAWRDERARAVLLGRLARRLERLYARRLPVAVRERARDWLAQQAATALVRGGLGARAMVLPANNARLLGELVYLSDLDAFDRLAPSDDALPAAIARLVATARTARDPFAAVREAAPRGRATGGP